MLEKAKSREEGNIAEYRAVFWCNCRHFNRHLFSESPEKVFKYFEVPFLETARVVDLCNVGVLACLLTGKRL